MKRVGAMRWVGATRRVGGAKEGQGGVTKEGQGGVTREGSSGEAEESRRVVQGEVLSGIAMGGGVIRVEKNKEKNIPERFPSETPDRSSTYC